MTELVVNIFLIIDRGKITGIKAAALQVGAAIPDEEKIALLQENLLHSYEHAAYFPPPPGKWGTRLSVRQFQKLQRLGIEHRLFEQVFEELGMPPEPLMLVTPVVNGVLTTQ